LKTSVWQAPDTLVGNRANRDAGKYYLLTEMPAAKAEKWAIRAFMALSRSGVEVPTGIASLGIVGVFMVGFQAFRYASFVEIEPLMDEMMTCIKAMPDPQNQNKSRALVDTDTMEIQTRWDLRKEILELHAGFTMAELASMLADSAKKLTTTSNPIPTSPDSSGA